MSCFIEVDYMYDETLSKSPSGKEVSAYVYISKFDRKKRIFFLKTFFKIPLDSQIHTIIHECSHLYHGTEDHAYIQEHHYLFLHEEERNTNTDSFVENVMAKRGTNKFNPWNTFQQPNSHWRPLRGIIH